MSQERKALPRPKSSASNASCQSLGRTWLTTGTTIRSRSRYALTPTNRRVLKSWRFKVERYNDLLLDPQCPQELLDDVDFMIKLARMDYKALCFMPEKILRDRNFIISAIHDNPDSWHILETLAPNGAGNFSTELQLAKMPKLEQVTVPLEHFDDPEIMLVAVRGPGQGWRALRFASDRLRSDSNFMLEAAEACGTAIQYASAEVLEDEKIVLAALSSQRAELKHVQSQQFHDAQPDGDSVAAKRRNAILVRRPSRASMTASVLNFAMQGEVFGRVPASRKIEASKEMQNEQIVALNLRLSDGNVLVLMGIQEPNGRRIEKCVLPCRTFPEGGDPQAAVSRLLLEELRPLAKGIQVQAGHNVKIKTAFSKRHGGWCQFSTAVFEATFVPGFRWQDVMTPLQPTGVDIRPRLNHRSGQTFCRRFSVEGWHARPDMFEFKYGEPEEQWPPVPREWPPTDRHVMAWLTPWEMRWIEKSEAGQKALRSWFSQLELP